MRKLTTFCQENFNASGAMGRLTTRMSEVKFPFGLEPQLLDKPGTSPWLTGCKPFRVRLGPMAWPLVGIGCFARGIHNDDDDLVLLLMPMKELLGHGIPLKDFMTFIDSPTGCALFEKHGKIAKLKQNTAVWCPYGWLVLPLSLKEVLSSAAKQSAGTESGPAESQATAKPPGDLTLSYVWDVPVFRTL